MGTTRPAGAGADPWPPLGASGARTSLEFGKGEDGIGGQVLPVSQPRQMCKTQAGSAWSPPYKEPPVGSEKYDGGETIAGPLAVEGLGAEGETLLERPKGSIRFELLSKLGGSF